MAYTFETSGNNTFLVFTIGQEDTLDTMTLGMITNNRIPGMIPVLYTQMNRDCFLKYNVTARVAVKQFFSGIVNRRRLMGVFSGVTAALAAAEEYMIDYGSLLLDTDYIYVDVSSCRAELICLPLIREAGAVDIGMFFKNIMFSTQFDQTENCDYVARIINHLNGAPVFVVEDFQRLLEELQGEAPSASAAYGGGQAAGHVAPQSVSHGKSPVRPVPDTQAKAGASSQPVPASQAKAGASSQPVPASQAKAGASSQSVPASQAKAGVSSRSVLVSPTKAGATSQPAPASQAKGPVSSPYVSSAASGTGFAVPGQGGEESFAVPGLNRAEGAVKPAAKRKTSEQSATHSAPEKEMSVLYLLQHYNKENAAAYKAQKEARKKGGKAASVAKPLFVDDAGFAVPGENSGSWTGASRQSQTSQPSVQPQMPQSPARQPSVQAQQFGMRQSQTMSPSPFSSEDNFGDTVVMGADGFGEDTVVMGESMAESAIRPCLFRNSNNEKILIDKPVFRIGKERSYVDYCISGNATVSRSHADIVIRDGQFFIVDNNSTNHTYVNGEMIPSNTEIPLIHGTRIRLSNEEFEFQTF